MIFSTQLPEQQMSLTNGGILLRTINIPHSDMAYSHMAYLNPCHFPLYQYVLVKGHVFKIGRSSDIPNEYIGLSSLQRAFLMLDLGSSVVVSWVPVFPSPAEHLTISTQLVASFPVQLVKGQIEEFLKLEYDGHVVYPGTILASNKLAGRVFKFEVKSGCGLITDKTNITCIVNGGPGNLIKIEEKSHDSQKFRDYSDTALDEVSLAVGVLEYIRDTHTEPYKTIRAMLWKHIQQQM